MTTPKGVVAIYTDPDGHVIASATDFNKTGMGGCTLQETQSYRAKAALAGNVVRAYCSTALTDALSNYLCQQILEALQEKGGKVTILPIGGER